jgi:hypothetical protein
MKYIMKKGEINELNAGLLTSMILAVTAHIETGEINGFDVSFEHGTDNYNLVLKKHNRWTRFINRNRRSSRKSTIPEDLPGSSN